MSDDLLPARAHAWFALRGMISTETSAMISQSIPEGTYVTKIVTCASFLLTSFSPVIYSVAVLDNGYIATYTWNIKLI